MTADMGQYTHKTSPTYIEYTSTYRRDYKFIIHDKENRVSSCMELNLYLCRKCIVITEKDHRGYVLNLDSAKNCDVTRQVFIAAAFSEGNDRITTLILLFF